jgi:23S rRNA pseudoU1915 N3-methylase RlmH
VWHKESKKMNVTKEQKAKALEIAKAQKVKAVWVNEKGEYFTSEDLASLSVKGKKDKYQEISTKVAAETANK